MDDDFNYWYLRPNGSFEVLCSARCDRMWRDQQDLRRDPARWPKGTYPLALSDLCISCRVCGDRLISPKWCDVHHDACPPPSWALTLAAVEFAEFFQFECDISIDQWRNAAIIGQQEPHLTGYEIGEKVLRQSGDD